MHDRFVKPEKFIPEKDFVPDRRIVSAALLNDKGEIVLFRRGEKNLFYPGYFHILTEKLEVEEDFVEGLIRGVFEETGIEILSEDIMRLGESEFTKWNGFCSEVGSYCVLIGDSEIELNREHPEYRLVKPSEVKDYEVTPTVIDILGRLEEFSSLDLK
jgi:ADP-ribose pyrophosphatase YjhB (NUDIX family)